METRIRRAERVSDETNIKPKKKHRGLKIVSLLILVIVLLVGIVGAKAYFDVKKVSNQAYQTIKRQTSAKLPNLTDRSAFSFLFLGVNGKTANNILVLTVNPKQNKTIVISLNRNIYLPSEATTLKELYGTKGTAGEIDAIQTLLKVDIPRYMAFEMSGLGDFVEAVGGVQVQNDTHFISSGYEFKNGSLLLQNAAEVKAFLRKVGDDAEKAEEDLIDREQSILIAIIPKMKSANTVFHYEKFANAFGKNIKTDFTFDTIKTLGIGYNGVLGNIIKENLRPIPTTIDGVAQKILSEAQITKAHDRIEEAINE
ncbi:LCP family protein [Pseudolactococcus reticulitermitis]|uniref:Cell envelope-related transcriptional attenuator domain-containing protein n=1 Tax=Pseudolactococcus reticulitermitis TaxID=2025039 RepID=A0A224WYL0_9LACT|nr:LCP family protein [Lactococcus reticulitermitis]GAX47219.1 hypothetical protein RsY01_817 [Lactococcus reticulitermitis]